jgi:hypothetical protein
MSKSSKTFNIRRLADDFNCAKTLVTFLQMPLVETYVLNEGIILIGQCFKDHFLGCGDAKRKKD